MSGAGSSDSGLDLSGKLIIKAQLGDDIRRIPIHNEDMTYDELILMMQRVFRCSLDPEDEITLKYKDDDGDLVTIFDTSDLSFAIQCSRILRLTILLSGETKGKPQRQDISTYAIKKELQEIRNRVTALIDNLDVPAPTSIPVPDSEQGATASGGAAAATPQNMQMNVNSREFDPLQPLQQQQQQGQQPSQLAQGTSQASPAVSTPTPVSSAPTQSEGVDSAANANAAPASTDNASNASGKSTPAPYQQAPQAQPQQSQVPQQQPHQQHPGYAGYPAAAAVPVPQRGAHMAYQGQPYGVPTSEAGGPPRGNMPPTSIPAGTPSQPGQQPQYFSYPPHPQYSGYVSGSPGAGFPQGYPGQPYPSGFNQAAPHGSAVPTAAVSQPSQQGPAGPRPAVNRYPNQPTQGYQQWTQ